MHLYESIHQGFLVLGGIERRIIVIAVVYSRPFLKVFLVLILVGILFQQLSSVLLIEIIILLLLSLTGHHYQSYQFGLRYSL